jgi:hypothetical protein
MSNVDTSDKWRRVSDTARNLLFPLIPFVVVGTVWSVAVAGSLEARVAAIDGNCRIDRRSRSDVVGSMQTRHRAIGIHQAVDSDHPFIASFDTDD